jgi:hypothetical protein
MYRSDSKLAAFFELLEEWQVSEDAKLFLRMWLPRLFGSRGQTRFASGYVRALGGTGVMCGGGRGGYFPFT